MELADVTEAPATVAVENIGGIEETEIELPPGVTVLAGKNATNRTSFLQSLMAAMGSNDVSLKGDANEGRVEFTYADTTYTRTLTRTNGSVRASGEGFLDDPTAAQLFAFLLQDNEARRAVARGEDLRELIMRPVDLDAIEREIRELESRKADINDELAAVESRKRELPDLEAERTSLEERIEETKAELAAKEQEIEESSQSLEETREDQRELEQKLDELRDTRSDLERMRREIETKTDAITSLKQERSDLEDELDELPDVPAGEIAELDDRIDDLRVRKRELDAEISELQSVIQFNEETIESADDAEAAHPTMADEAATDGSITDQLVEDDAASVTCWTCGTEVERQQIERTLDNLRERRKEIVGEMSEIEDSMDDLKSQRRDLKRKQGRKEEIERKLRDIESEIERRENTVESLRERRDDLTDDVEELESVVDDLESEDFGDVLDLHKEANQLEFELERLETDLEDVSDEIEQIETRVREAEELRDERESLVEDLTDLRTRVDQIEAEAVEEFNKHMDTVLDVLEYENIDRIWIERLERDVREGNRIVAQTTFELHIVRKTASGTAYEDTIDHLSESEREVTGLVFALAGYLVHDLHERVPFMLLDSLEAIDSDRIAALVDYFADYAEFLVVALLPEDAQALDDDYNRVASI